MDDWTERLQNLTPIDDIIEGGSAISGFDEERLSTIGEATCEDKLAAARIEIKRLEELITQLTLQIEERDGVLQHHTEGLIHFSNEIEQLKEQIENKDAEILQLRNALD